MATKFELKLAISRLVLDISPRSWCLSGCNKCARSTLDWSQSKIFLVAIVIAKWSHYMHIRQRLAIYGNGKESFYPILDPDADPDHYQNLTNSKVGIGNVQPSLKISAKSTCNFLCNPANKQTDACYHITALAKVISH